VESLIEAIEDLKAQLNIPGSIQEAKVDEKAFMASLDQLSEMAFDDQCTGANPRFPLFAEIKQLYIQAYRPKARRAVA
jgi:acetaldehyde dehydrogenase/alcohol dehydrogenase